MYPIPCSVRALAGLLVAAALVVSPGRAADAAAGSAPAPASPASIENSVVKVFATVRRPDLISPWAKQSPSEISGSGVVIEGRRILTNAHVVLYASQVQIQGFQAGDKLSATVESIAPGIDLAVLKLDDESFFDTHAPLPRASRLPGVKDAVMVYGYPTGGTSLSITKGIVSRIDFVGYNYFVSGLRIQIDAAINAGNSGGPAVAGDKMIGLAFSRLGGGAENIGYIIPCEEIDLFLKDIADGHYDGKPGIYDEFQTLENPALRAFLHLDKSVEGLVMHQPVRDDPDYPLKEWDVITRIGDTPVDDQGMIKLGEDLRVNFAYLVQKIVQNGRVPLTVVRAGKELKIELPVSPVRPKLLPYLQGDYPEYFIYGPIVFAAATDDFAGLLGNGSSGVNVLRAFSFMGSPLVTRRGDKPAFSGEELVVVPRPFFPHKLAKGYSIPAGRVVQSINGIPIKNLHHLVEVLRDAQGEFITIAFAGHETESMVFPRKEMIAATDDILTDNGIRSQGSPDLLLAWNGKPAK